MPNPTATAVTLKSIGVGICYHPSHCPFCPYPTNGIVISGFPSKTIGPNTSAVVGGIVLSNCGHIGILVTGSDFVKSGNISQCKVGSQFTGDFVGEIVTGADNHITG